MNNLRSSTSGDAIHLGLNGKFHTCTCAGPIDEKRAFASITMFFFSRSFTYPTTTVGTWHQGISLSGYYGDYKDACKIQGSAIYKKLLCTSKWLIISTKISNLHLQSDAWFFKGNRKLNFWKTGPGIFNELNYIYSGVKNLFEGIFKDTMTSFIFT